MRKVFIVVLALCVGGALAFGVPGVPDVPDTPEVPEIEIPGLDLLDEVQVTLNEVIASTDTLRGLIPELGALDELSVKLEELRDTDPEIEALQAELDGLRDQLVSARAEIQGIADGIDAEIGGVRDTVNEFIDGLPMVEPVE